MVTVDLGPFTALIDELKRDEAEYRAKAEAASLEAQARAARHLSYDGSTNAAREFRAWAESTASFRARLLAAVSKAAKP